MHDDYLLLPCASSELFIIHPPVASEFLLTTSSQHLTFTLPISPVDIWTDGQGGFTGTSGHAPRVGWSCARRIRHKTGPHRDERPWWSPILEVLPCAMMFYLYPESPLKGWSLFLLNYVCGLVAGGDFSGSNAEP